MLLLCMPTGVFVEVGHSSRVEECTQDSRLYALMTLITFEDNCTQESDDEELLIKMRSISYLIIGL